MGEGNVLEKRKEALVDELANFLLTPAGIARIEFAELFEDLIVFEVDANDFVIVTAALDGGPIHQVIGGGALRIAHVGLLKNFLEAGTGLATGDELSGREPGTVDAVDNVNETEFDGIGDGDAVV